MEPHFDAGLAANYKSPSQRIRILSENWVNQEIFCPSCGKDIMKYESNRPVADFYCVNCHEDYELKSKKNEFGSKIVNGAYKMMIQRLLSSNNPNLFLLNYTLDYEIFNFFVIPKYFFVPQIIEKREPLSQKARRAGWIGCNIILQDIPQSGKIFYIKEKHVENKNDVLKNWQKTAFLKKEKDVQNKGWIIDIMKCIENLNKKEFTLTEMYNYESHLQKVYPNNRHIKDKIRQQLQFLRDRNYLEFIEKGKYRVI